MKYVVAAVVDKYEVELRPYEVVEVYMPFGRSYDTFEEAEEGRKNMALHSSFSLENLIVLGTFE